MTSLVLNNWAQVIYDFCVSVFKDLKGHSF